MPTEMYTIPGEYTGVGSAYQVFKQYYKDGLDKSGYKPVFISPEVLKEKKNKAFIN